MMAVNCGTPTPATTLVVQLAPAPMPTLTLSLPASINAFVPSAVATLPAITLVWGNSDFKLSTVFKTPIECPCAVSTTKISTSASISAAARSIVSSDTPMAAPTLSRPLLSLQALGNCSFFLISFTVISPVRLPLSLTTRSFSIRCFWSNLSASFREVFSGTVTRSFDVILDDTSRSPSFSKRISRLVIIPTNFPSSTTGRPLILYSDMILFALWIVLSGSTVIGLRIIPLSERLTLSTIAFWASIL